MKTLWALTAAALWLGGCASTSAQGARDEVASKIAEGGGPTLDPGDGAARQIDAWLADELTVERALQIGLWQSPRLRALLEQLSISQAELVDAGALPNPSITLGSTAWEQHHIAPNLFGVVEWNFLGALTMPLQRKVAATELEVSKAEVAHEVLGYAAEVRRAYYEACAAQQIAALQALIAEAALMSAEFAARSHEAGTANDLTLESERAQAAQQRIEKLRADGVAAASREKLNALLGLWGPRTHWRLPKTLPALPASELAVESLEARAVAERPDLLAARRKVQAMRRSLTLAKTTRWTGMVHFELEGGRLRETKRLSFGPSVGLEIPLFDQRRGAVAKLEALVRQSEHRVADASISARAEVREAVVRMQLAREVASAYSGELLPSRERLLAALQLHYDAMLAGVYQLLEAKRSEFEAYRETVEALRDYWLARTDLQWALGVPLAGAEESARAPLAGAEESAGAPLAGAEESARAPLAGTAESGLAPRAQVAAQATQRVDARSGTPNAPEEKR